MSRCNLRKSLSFASFLLKQTGKFTLVVAALLILINITSISVNLTGRYTIYNAISFHTLTAALTMIAAFTLPFILLNYIHNKQQLDLYYNLPFKRRDILNISILVGFLLLLIIYVCGWISTTIIASVFVPDMLSIHLHFLFGNFISVVSLYFLTTLAILATASYFDASVMTSILVLFPMLFIFAIFYLYFLLSANSFPYTEPLLLSMSSPLALLINTFNISMNLISNFQTEANAPIFVTYLLWLPLAALCWWHANKIENNKKLEHIHTAADNSKIYYGTIIFAAISLQLLFSIESISLQSLKFGLSLILSFFPVLFIAVVYGALLVFVRKSYNYLKRDIFFHLMLGSGIHLIVILIIYLGGNT